MTPYSALTLVNTPWHTTRMSETSVQKPLENLSPIFLHAYVDDLPLTLGAFRVYGHLSRRAGSNNFAWPSYNAIGEHCFRATYPNAKPETLRRKAIAAVVELEKLGIISVERRKLKGREGNNSNAYRLLKLREWPKKLAKYRFDRAEEAQ